MDSNETLAARYGDRWQPVTFTAKSKREIGSLIKTAFDDADQVIPPLADATKFVGVDIYSIQCDRSGDNLKLVETPNPLLPESHCDVAYSLGLSRMAAGIVACEPFMSVIG